MSEPREPAVSRPDKSVEVITLSPDRQRVTFHHVSVSRGEAIAIVGAFLFECAKDQEP